MCLYTHWWSLQISFNTLSMLWNETFSLHGQWICGQIELFGEIVAILVTKSISVPYWSFMTCDNMLLYICVQTKPVYCLHFSIYVHAIPAILLTKHNNFLEYTQGLSLSCMCSNGPFWYHIWPKWMNTHNYCQPQAYNMYVCMMHDGLKSITNFMQVSQISLSYEWWQPTGCTYVHTCNVQTTVLINIDN